MKKRYLLDYALKEQKNFKARNCYLSFIQGVFWVKEISRRGSITLLFHLGVMCDPVPLLSSPTPIHASPSFPLLAPLITPVAAAGRSRYRRLSILVCLLSTPLFLILTASMASYLNCLACGFVFDDITAIKDNKANRYFLMFKKIPFRKLGLSRVLYEHCICKTYFQTDCRIREEIKGLHILFAIIFVRCL